jgi:hypothetical protein
MSASCHHIHSSLNPAKANLAPRPPDQSHRSPLPVPHESRTRPLSCPPPLTSQPLRFQDNSPQKVQKKRITGGWGERVRQGFGNGAPGETRTPDPSGSKPGQSKSIKINDLSSLQPVQNQRRC